MRRSILILALLATSAHADELRVRSNGTLTTYVGELTGINPLVGYPNEIRFQAETSTSIPLSASAKPFPPQPMAWKIYVSLPEVPYLILTCFGNVPAFVGMNFAFDVVCQS